MKTTVFSQEVPTELFSAENTLKLMEQDKEKLVANWGEYEYNLRLELLKKYIEKKNAEA